MKRIFMVCVLLLMIAPSSAPAKEEETCESLQDQFDFYRRVAQQDRKQLEADLKNKSNQRAYKQKAIRMQIREMEEAQKKSRELHKKLEAQCSPT